MAASRQLPISYNSATYGTGKTYTDLGVWEPATDNDLPSATNGEVLLVDAGNWVDDVIMADTICDADYFRVVKPASGAKHSGIPKFDGSCAAFSSSNQYRIFSLRETNSQVQDICGRQTHADFNGGLFQLRGACQDAAFVGCLAKGDAGAGNTGEALFQSYSRDDSNKAFFINCMGIDADDAGLDVDSGVVYAYNVTIKDSDLGNFSVASGGTLVCKNCLSDNAGSNDYGGAGTPTLTTCGSSDATGSAGLQSQTYNFVDADNDDLHLSSDSDGINDGTDLSSDSDYDFNDDIDGDTRTGDWDIGFDEYVLNNLSLDTYDVLDIADNIAHDLPLGDISQYINIAITEDAESLIPLAVSIHEDCETSESLEDSLPLPGISKYVTITLEELKSALTSIAPIVFESMTASELASLIITIKPSLAESININESVDYLFSPINLLASDLLDIVESIVVGLTLDKLITAETISINSFRDLLINIETNIHETINIEENIEQAIPLSSLIADGITLTEFEDLLLQIAPNTYQNIAITEDIEGAIKISFSVHDLISLTETVSAFFCGENLSTQELLTIVEQATFRFDWIVQSASDTIQIVENIVSIVQGCVPLTYDQAILSEIIMMRCFGMPPLLSYDNVGIVENCAVRRGLGGILRVYFLGE